MNEHTGEATRLLRRLETGDEEASGELLAILYRELRSIADRYMQRERTGHTLQPTALVHEAYVRLIDAELRTHVESRGHFVRLAARAMRRVLVDHARTRDSAKRGGGGARQGLDDALLCYEENRLDVVALNEALERMQVMDAQLARVVELRFFAGLTIAETAAVLEVSTPTVERAWRVARMWLRSELEPVEEGGDGP